MNEDFEEFITERINKGYYKLRRTDKWKTDSEQYANEYNELYNQLNEEQRNKLERIIDTKNLLTSYESEFAYKLGFTDFIKSFNM